MKAKEEILDSGVLEAHVLAGSSTEDIQLVESMTSHYPEIELAIEESQSVLEELAFNQAKPLPEGFKDKIKAKLDFKPAIDSIATKQSIQGVWQNLAVAASLAAVVSLGANVFLSLKVNSTESALQLSQQQTQRLAAETGFIKERQQESASQLNILLTDNKKTIILSGQPFAPQAKATVYWSGDEVYLFATNFPANTPDVQYQLWAITDGAPVDAGVFDVGANSNGLIKLKNISKATAFAVTVEKRGGSAAPTLDKMVVLGTVDV